MSLISMRNLNQMAYPVACIRDRKLWASIHHGEHSYLGLSVTLTFPISSITSITARENVAPMVLCRNTISRSTRDYTTGARPLLIGSSTTTGVSQRRALHDRVHKFLYLRRLIWKPLKFGLIDPSRLSPHSQSDLGS